MLDTQPNAKYLKQSIDYWKTAVTRVKTAARFRGTPIADSYPSWPIEWTTPIHLDEQNAQVTSVAIKTAVEMKGTIWVVLRVPLRVGEVERTLHEPVRVREVGLIFGHGHGFSLGKQSLERYRIEQIAPWLFMLNSGWIVSCSSCSTLYSTLGEQTLPFTIG